MENILILTNAKLNNIIESINKEKDIDHLNKANTDVDNIISEEITTSINSIFESIVPIIEFFTNPSLTEIFFEQNIAITELLQVHYEYIESTKDSPDFNQEVLEDYLINFYSYKTSSFSTYLTCSETIRHELTRLKSEFENIGKSDDSDKTDIVGGGLFDRAAVLSSIALLLGSSFIGITQSTQESQLDQPAQASQKTPSNNMFAVQEITPQNQRYATDLFEDRVTVPKSIYTSTIGATLGTVATVGAIGAISKWVFGDAYSKAWEDLLRTVGEVNVANNAICTDAVRALSPYFQTPAESFDMKGYDITQEENFDDILTSAAEAIDNADIKVETLGLVRPYKKGFSLGSPVDKSLAHTKASFVEMAKDIEGTVISPAEATRFTSDVHDAVSDIIKNRHQKAGTMKIFEKEKLFELGGLCHSNLFNVRIEGDEAVIGIDLHNNAFREATYENILDNFARNPSKDATQIVQYGKLQNIMKTLNPIDLLGKISGVLAQAPLGTKVVIPEMTSMLAKYRDALNIIRTHDDPSAVFEDIKKREDIQAQEEQRRIQAEFDMEVSRNATILAEKEAAALVDSRVSAANQTSLTLDALATYWSAWASGSVGVVLDPVAAGVNETVSTVVNLAVNQTYTLFSKSLNIAVMAATTLAAGILLLTCFNSSRTISAGLSSMISRAVARPSAAASTPPAAAPAAPAPAAPAPAAPAPALRRTRWGSEVPFPVPVPGKLKTTNFGAPVGPQSVYDLDPRLIRKGGKNKQTRKKRRTRKNKRTRKNRRTKKNKRAQKNKNKTHKK